MKLLLVGEAPGPGGAWQPGPALEGQAARLLATLAGMEVQALLDRTERVNLLNHWPGPAAGGGSAFPLELGRAGFHRVLTRLDQRYVIFLGRAADAALPESLGYFIWARQRYGTIVFHAARFPHPSGLNRLWNSPELRTRASAFLRGALELTEV